MNYVSYYMLNINHTKFKFVVWLTVKYRYQYKRQPNLSTPKYEIDYYYCRSSGAPHYVSN